MQDPLKDAVCVDGIILTEVIRQATSRASSDATYYGLYFKEPGYWLPIEKTVCAGNLPGVSRAYQEINKIKDALKPLSELSFACFPDYSTQRLSLRIFVVFQDKATAEAASKLLVGYSGKLSPGKIFESGPEILESEGLKEHLIRPQPLADVPVLVGFLDKQVILRIGSNDNGKYRKDFRWLLNTDIYYDPDCLDRPNEVSLILDPDCTYRPTTSGSPGSTGFREVDSVADMISCGILTMLGQVNTDLAITLAFHKGRRTEKLRSQLQLINDSQIVGANDAHREGQIDEYRPKSSRRYKPSPVRDHSSSNVARERGSKEKGKEHPDRSGGDSVGDPRRSTPSKEKNISELYLPEFLGLEKGDKGSDGPSKASRRSRRGGKGVKLRKGNGHGHATGSGSGRQHLAENLEGNRKTNDTGNKNEAKKGIGARMKVRNRQNAARKPGKEKSIPGPLGSGRRDRKTHNAQDLQLKQTRGKSPGRSRASSREYALRSNTESTTSSGRRSRSRDHEDSSSRSKSDDSKSGVASSLL